MYTQTLIATTLLFGASALAQKPTSAVADPLDKALTRYSDVATAIDNWASTESAIPSLTADAQNNDYFNNIVTGTNADVVPAYVTALPSSLQQGASSIFHGAASVVKSDVDVLTSAGTPLPSVVAKLTAASSFATSGKPSNSANGTTSGSPTSPSSAPSPSKTPSGAGKNEVMAAAGALVIALTGVMAML